MLATAYVRFPNDRVLLTLEASDPDGGSVTYEILSYTGDLKPFDRNGIDFLDVNATSGVVTTKRPIDYEVWHLVIILLSIKPFMKYEI